MCEEEPGWAIGIKDGWYPGLAGWRVNSSGVAIDPGGTPRTIAVVLTKNQESLEYGQETIEGVAERVRAALLDARTGVSMGDPAPLPGPATVVQRFVPAITERDEEDGTGRPNQRPSHVDDFGMGDMLRHDAERLRILVERHKLHTGSARAKALLDDWDNALTKFVKVMPRDYAAALKQLEAERDEAATVAAE